MWFLFFRRFNSTKLYLFEIINHFHLSCFRKSCFFETRMFFPIHCFNLYCAYLFYLSCGRIFRPQVLSYFTIILWSQKVTSSLSGSATTTITIIMLKKKDWVLRYSILEFLVISFADSVAVFDSLSDCSFLCQYWYFC